MDVSRLFARIGRLFLDDCSGDLFSHCTTAVQEVTDSRVVADLLAAIGDRPAALESLRDASFEHATTVLACLQEMLTHAVYGIWIENPYIEFWRGFSFDVDESEITELVEVACSYFLLFPVADDGSPQTVQSATRAIMALKWKREALDHAFVQLFSTPGTKFRCVPDEGETVDNHRIRVIAEGVVQLMLARPDIQIEQERRLAGAH